MSVFEQFRYNRDNRADAAAFLIAAGDRSVPIAWRQFAEDIEAIAWLVRRFAPNTTVGLLGENSYEWMTAHAAGLFAGVTVVPIETNLTAAEIADRLIFTGARFLIHSALYAEKAHEVEKLVPNLIVGGFGSPKAEELLATARAALEMGDDSVFDGPGRDEDEVAMLVFTSGTTSRPRGVSLTLRSLATFAAFAAEKLPMKPGDHSLMLLPLQHIYGLSMTYLMLMRGVALGVCPDFRRFGDAIARFRANFLCVVPALADILAEKIERRGRCAEDAFARPLAWVLSGGAPLSRRSYERLARLGVNVLQIYGMTETCALYAMSPFDDPRPGSVGRAGDAKFGLETRVSERGTLLIRGPAVMKGYFREDAQTAQKVSPDGWYDTGDLGSIDADGYVWLTGRASRTILLSSGQKVAPEELEEKLLDIPGIHEAFVSGNGDTREITATIYASVSQDTLQRQVDVLNRQMPVHKRIRRVVARNEPFPRTASGKICVEALYPVEPKTAAEPAPRWTPLEAPPPTTRRRRKAMGVSCIVATVTVTAAAVLLLNGVQAFLVRNRILLPHGLSVVLDFVEDTGELLLALLILPCVFVIHHVLRKVRKRDS